MSEKKFDQTMDTMSVMMELALKATRKSAYREGYLTALINIAVSVVAIKTGSYFYKLHKNKNKKASTK